MSNVGGPSGKSRSKATRATQRQQAAKAKGSAAKLASETISVSRTTGDPSTTAPQQKLSAAHPQLEHPTAQGTSDKGQMASALKKLKQGALISPSDLAKRLKKSSKSNAEATAALTVELQENIKANTGKPLDDKKAFAGINDIQNGNRNTENANYLMMVLQGAMYTLGQSRLKTSGNQAQALQVQQQYQALKAQESAQKAQKSQKESKGWSLASKILGWVGTGALVIFAVAATIATAGAAAPLLAVAAVALTFQILSETGVMGKLANVLAGALEKAGMSKQVAAIVAQAIITVAVLAIMIGLSVATGGLGAAGAISESMEMIQLIYRGFTVAETVGKAGTNVGSGVYQYKAEMSMADKTRFDGAFKQIQFYQDQITKDLSRNIKKMTALMQDASKMVSSNKSTLSSIADNIS